jgi:predicted nucleotidyltransferase
MPSENPVEVLFGAYHRRILGLLLLHPDESFYVREIARLAGVPAGSVHRELKRLGEVGLLLRESVGNQVRYCANREDPVFPELAGIFRKTEGLADVLRAALASRAAEIDVAFIFGSMAQGKERVTSDIDVFIVGSVSFVDAVKALAKTKSKLGREVNPVVMPRKQFHDKHAAHDRFVLRILQEPKLFLIGGMDDIGKLVENRATKKSHH